MISVLVEKNNNKIISIYMNGHANYVDEGYDMVCSAVSAVSLTIANGITEILKVNPQIEVRDGFLNIDLKNVCSSDIERSQILLETMVLGLKSMEMNYSDYIKVKIEEV